MNERDLDLFRDMRDYAREAVELVADRDADALTADRMRYLAACRTVEIVGEAASKISEEGRSLLPGFPWRSAVNMRNILIHAYGHIQARVVVETVRDDLPDLIEKLERLLPEEPV